MEQWTAPDCGSIRIKNPKTLQKWIDKGWFKREIDNGYIFAYRCGRFRTEICQCAKCKKPNAKIELRNVLEKNGLLMRNDECKTLKISEL